MLFRDYSFVEDAYLTDHQQTHILDNVAPAIRHRCRHLRYRVGTLSLQASAIGEIDLEIKDDRLS